MGNNHDSIAFDWVRGDIQSLLTQGQQALESYVDNHKDTARLRFCLNCLHRVRGTLQMVELYGASLLTEEMAKLTQAILGNRVDNENEAFEVLMQALLQLPQYLDHIDSSSDDFPLVLLPLLNDLRAAHGEALLSDTSLFNPDMSQARARNETKNDQLHKPKVREHVRKLRQMYQFALAGVVREANLGPNFDYMQKVIKRLVRLCQKTPRGELWRAAAGFVETLQLKANPVNAAVKSLLQELDSEIRQLTENPSTALAHPAPEALFKNLLYYVARARELDSPRIEALRTDYQLAQALPSGDDVDAARSRVNGPNRDAIHSVVHALNEELTKLKNLLSLFVRADLRGNDGLEDLLPGLQQVANTLAVIGLGVPRKVVNEQIDLVAQLVRQDQRVSDSALVDIAGALLCVEASLANLGQDSPREDTDQRHLLNLGSRELGGANGALLKASRSALEQAKSAIVNFVASQWDSREIEHLPALLHGVCGGLRLMPLERASKLLKAMERYVSDVLLSGREVPNRQELDTLADAVISIEYYLERLNNGIRDNDGVLRVAEISLESLGFPPGKAPTWCPKAGVNETDISLMNVPLLEAPLLDTVSSPVLDAGAPPGELIDGEILAVFIEEAGEEQARAHRLADGKDVLAATGTAAAREAAPGDVLRSPKAVPRPEPDNKSDLDPLLLNIFESEARSHLNTVEDYIANAAGKQTAAYTDELTRALHTLKGSAHATGITPIADLVAPLERFVKDARAENKRCDRDAIFLLEQGVSLLNQGLLQLHSQPLAKLPGGREFLKQLAQLARATLKGTGYGDPRLSSANSRSALLKLLVSDDINIVLNASSVLDSWIANPANGQALEQLRDELARLTAATEVAGLNDIAALSAALQRGYSILADSDRKPEPELQACLHRAHEQLINMMDQAAAGLTIDSADPLRQQIMELTDDVLASGAFLAEFQQDEDPNQHPHADNEPAAAEIAFEAPVPPCTSDTEDHRDRNVLETFQREARELIDSTADALQRFSQDGGDHDLLRLLQRDLHTLKGGARLSKVGSIGDLAHELEALFERLVQRQLAILPVLSDLLFSCHDRLASMVATLENGDNPRSAPDLIAEIQRYSSAAASAGADPSPVALQRKPGPDAHDTNSVTTDPELMGIFLEEAYDLINATGSALHSWSKNPENNVLAAELQRDVHTLKGGARMAGADAMGDLAHALEDLFELITRGKLKPGPELYGPLFACHDRLAAMVEKIATGEACPPAQDLIAQVRQMHAPPQAKPSALSQKPAPVEQPAAAQETPARAQTRKTLRTAQETVRVSAPLLDELVNLAGETSITRGRLEQQTTDFSHALEEMTATIERLREQLRRMDIETETQILFRAEKELGPDGGEDVDPLEMDRYWSMQQLSRALSESSSDLIDLRQTLADRIRDTETLLAKQSRINTELQEGLMKTRMVPFASVVPRLRRIVRQISAELDKKANFEVYNAEDEIDRNVLERMIAPLEHMLRNALGHGIEAPAERLAAGKAEIGEISLALQRENGDVVLRMRDDGAGISTEQVRNKAVSQGLIGPNEVLTEREVLQLIITPGFSTAKEVTQVSGRGIGMDVVASKIKQLGGSLDIHSSAGHGTALTVRLPFTVSFNRALMITSGDNFYAVPLNTIEGIVRVSARELEEYYKPDAPLYKHAGREYRLQYLGSLLNSEHPPKLQGQALPLPVILVRGVEQPMALQVDSLVGSRDIVVQSLGPQFNSVRGVSGGTILGDGNVVVILDLPAMIRSDILSEQPRTGFKTDQPRQKPQLHQRATLVMVVDDSVTVRKVTSRLLERNGMNVMTAKDGLDAVAQLQDYQPDIILLDIDMPRMDGFEVAGFVRHNDVLRTTPICMITSHAGEKQRERALAIGVNEYLGKPFQEATLLETLRRLTGDQ